MTGFNQCTLHATPALPSPSSTSTTPATDKFAVRTLLTEVIDSCRSEVLVSKHGGSFPVAALREALPRDLALLERGIRMRSLYQHATRFDQPTRTHAEQLGAAGAEIHTLPEVLPQMIVVDRALAVLPAPRRRRAAHPRTRPPRLPPGRLRMAAGVLGSLEAFELDLADGGVDG
ncbi:hypothetical protein [Streptomyces sp. NBC_00272]|uniref:hypothetical protein n=1 Tax=Streptomyces sp. NBC_00272 TaxID=2975698 RepID=UPI002E2E86D9|nr:hypothetical protein [Streptomyces sp. NBC_00272]